MIVPILTSFILAVSALPKKGGKPRLNNGHRMGLPNPSNNGLPLNNGLPNLLNNQVMEPSNPFWNNQNSEGNTVDKQEIGGDKRWFGGWPAWPGMMNPMMFGYPGMGYMNPWMMYPWGYGMGMGYMNPWLYM